MSDIVQMKVEKRERSGTGSSRDLRAKNYVPGIVYGEKKDPVLISIDEKALKINIQDSGFFSKQCELNLGNEIFKVLPKDIQLHPVKESILHIDFLRVGENTTVTLYVPVKFVNENSCPGLRQGGVINVVRHEVELKTPVSKIPEFLEANLDNLEIGDSIHISSIELESGVTPTIKDRDFTIATIAPPTVMKVEEEKPAADDESTTDSQDSSTEKDSKEDAENKTESSENKDAENKKS
ncbi:MAG: 50S ribosomal protein L25/general stress protein Ctc [Pseudomonadota bacterium]|nr:50S ribosomal protein L25/general stress protein Ctc [Pseudomonadota bacterium]